MKAKVKDIINIMNRLAPKKFAESWDNPGLQIGNPDRNRNRVNSIGCNSGCSEKSCREKSRNDYYTSSASL